MSSHRENRDGTGMDGGLRMVDTLTGGRRLREVEECCISDSAEPDAGLPLYKTALEANNNVTGGRGEPLLAKREQAGMP